MNKLLYKLKLTFCIFLSVVNFSSFGQAPSGTAGNWLMGFNQTRLQKNWSIHTEAQYRSFEIIPNTEQMLLRGGINYHLNNTAFASIGYAYVTNYSYDKEQLPGVQVSENRIWQQFLMRNNTGRYFFEHRYRLEQRWIQLNNTARYLDRIRYLLYGAIGYQFLPKANIQLGYLAQTANNATKQYLQVAIFYNVDFRKKE